MACGAWLASRLVLACIGGLAYWVDGQPIPWLGLWIQWDANYYLSILTHGYREPTIVTGLETGQSNLNFFPLLPVGGWLVARIVAWPALAGLMFANACLVAAAIGLHRVATRRFGVAAADWSVVSLMALPGSFALSGFMTESLFLAISIWSFHFFATGRSGAAAGLGSLLSITRMTGVALAAGLALDWLMRRARRRPADYATLFLICLMPLPLVGFMVYMDWLTGDGLAFLHSQFGFWQHRLDYPLANFFLFLSSDQPRLVVQSAIGLALLLCLLWSAPCFTAGELLFVGVNVVSFASSESASPSLLRYMISLYPLHLALGQLGARKPAIRVLIVTLALVDGAMMTYWARGYDLFI